MDFISAGQSLVRAMRPANLHGLRGAPVSWRRKADADPA
jgi:hypothetical protein